LFEFVGDVADGLEGGGGGVALVVGDGGGCSIVGSIGGDTSGLDGGSRTFNGGFD
jgi:hypothetical protein